MSNELIAPSQQSRAVLVRLSAVTVAVLLISLLVLNNSRAAFTDTTEATGTWSAATVDLTHALADGITFDIDGLAPGNVVSRTVTVTYDEEATAADEVDVRLYGGEFIGELAQYLSLEVTAAGNQIYEGDLDGFTAADFDSGIDTWNGVEPGANRDYVFNVTLVNEVTDGDIDDAQGESAEVAFVWEAQTTE